MYYMIINNIFIFLLVISLIFLVIDPKIKQPCYSDLLSVLGAAFGTALLLTNTDLNYTLEGTSFRVVMCTWVIYSVVRKFLRSREVE